MNGLHTVGHVHIFRINSLAPGDLNKISDK